jgi:integrase
MASVKYKTKTKNDFNSIFIRFKDGLKFDIELSTGIKVPKNRWSATKQSVLETTIVDYIAINEKLKELESFILKEYTSSLLGTTFIINPKWLKEKITFFFKRKSENKDLNQKIFFTDFIGSYISESYTRKTRSGRPLVKRTIQHYQTTLNKVKEFELYIGKNVLLSKVNLEFHTSFIHYLENIQILGNNTIGGYVDDIKQFCKDAELKRNIVSNEYQLKAFYSPSNKTQDTYLKESEIIKIFEFDFTNDYLDNARDWLIIGLRTGLRISDFIPLTPKDIIDGFIEISTKKTDFPVIIPLHSNVIEILNKRAGNFPRVISDQKFNEYVKIVAKNSGLTEIVSGGKITEITVEINGIKEKIHRKVISDYPKYELVSSHICRRSFATNLYGRLDTLTIMKITGHSTEKQFLGYIKVTPKEYAQMLKAYWNNQKDIT